MTHKIFPILGMLAATGATMLTGCSDEQTLLAGEGKMFLSTRVNSDVKVESRAVDDLAASTIVWISNSEGVVRKYNGISEVPVDGIKLMSGEYTIKAWAGDLKYASFDSRWFEGQETVTLAAGDKKSVEVVCKIANVVTSVKYAEGLSELISDYSVTVSHKGGSLTFEGDDVRKGYFMMPEGVTTLDYVFNATSDGKPISLRGTIENVQPAHEYVLNILSQGTEADQNGAGFITIEIDDQMTEIADEVVITTPPAITGYGFDINTPVAGASGSITRKSVYVCAASPLTSVIVSGIEGEADIDLCKAASGELAALATKGISHEVTDVDGGQMMKIIFDDVYLNTLPNRDEPYVISFTATDQGRKTTRATLQLRISEAPAITNPVKAENIDYATAVLEGQVAKDGVESVGFEYRVKGSAQDWTYVAADAQARAAYAKGQTVTATVSGLEIETAYEYRMVSGTVESPAEFKAEILEFATKETPQLPYADMEDWGTDTDKAAIPMTTGGEIFWDNGNHGSQTLGKNITNPSTAIKHGGTRSAELHSQFVGMGIIGKFACGNLFIGKYIETIGTDGVIGFGRPLPFEIPTGLKIKSVKLWVKYNPQPVSNSKDECDFLKQGDMDQGHIYVALFDGPDNGDEDANNHGKYGYVVRTKNQSRLFDKQAVNVCAYGERIFTEATPGSGMVEVEIPFEYYAGKGTPKMIAITCAASRYGDYFSGGRDTKMYIDDVKLVYEAL